MKERSAAYERLKDEDRRPPGRLAIGRVVLAVAPETLGIRDTFDPAVAAGVDADVRFAFGEAAKERRGSVRLCCSAPPGARAARSRRGCPRRSSSGQTSAAGCDARRTETPGRWLGCWPRICFRSKRSPSPVAGIRVTQVLSRRPHIGKRWHLWCHRRTLWRPMADGR
jgi:hypothetical protein